MGTLDTAVRVAESWLSGRRTSRDALLRQLEGVVRGYEEARGIWQEYIDVHERSPLVGSRWTILNWIGPERAHRLWAVNRRINEHMSRIAEMTGADLPWAFPTDEVMIDLADKQLVQHPTENGLRAARAAIDLINDRIAHAHRLIDDLKKSVE